AEHKAYLHRSGRTARAGAGGVVITLQTPAQAHEVRTLMRRAGVVPVAATVSPRSPLLRSIAGPPAPPVPRPARPTAPGPALVARPATGRGAVPPPGGHPARPRRPPATRSAWRTSGGRRLHRASRRDRSVWAQKLGGSGMCWPRGALEAVAVAEVRDR